MKLGTRVHLRFSPENRGTVTGLDGKRIRVSWDSEPNHRGRTIRHWYDDAEDTLKHGMEVGNPA